MGFENLGLGAELLKVIADCGYTKPTPIQEKAIPSVLMSRDVVGIAQTGTGKTACFILPMIDILAGGRAKMRMPRSLVLEPTRELAAQVAENFDTLGKGHKLSRALLVGGESMNEQKKILDSNVDVLIATPGRLLDLFEKGSILLNDIKILVIDEADRMLDMGFIPDIEKIVSKIPAMRQTLLFSATMPPAIEKLTHQFLQNPKRISVAAQSSVADTVKQALVWTDKRNKKKTLTTLIEAEDVNNAFIFCNRKRDIGELVSWLKKSGHTAAAMHGDMAQKERYAILDKFKGGDIKLMVCSDVAARGLDIKEVSHVFNYDVPFNAEDYVHRIGRTGRAGHKGCAWTMAVHGDDNELVEAIETLIKRKIPVEESKEKGKASNIKPMPQKSSDKPKHDNNRKNNRPQPDDDKDEDVLGFGDEIPGFFQKK